MSDAAGPSRKRHKQAPTSAEPGADLLVLDLAATQGAAAEALLTAFFAEFPFLLRHSYCRFESSPRVRLFCSSFLLQRGADEVCCTCTTHTFPWPFLPRFR